MLVFTRCRLRKHLFHATSYPNRNINTINISDSDITRLASQSCPKVTLYDLIKHGRPPLTPTQLFSSANFTISHLPSRLAQRILALRSLPYVVFNNPSITQIHNTYLSSLSTLLPYSLSPINSLSTEQSFTNTLISLIKQHNNSIPTLSRGLFEARKYLLPKTTSQFLDDHFRSTIGSRVLSEQHIALHLSSSHPLSSSTSNPNDENPPNEFGILSSLPLRAVLLSTTSLVREISLSTLGHAGPRVVIDGDVSCRILHVAAHIQYVLTEILKNSFRASIQHSPNNHLGDRGGEIRITIAAVPSSTSSTTSLSNGSGMSDGVTIRIRDRGGGIHPRDKDRLFECGFSTYAREKNGLFSMTHDVEGRFDLLSTMNVGGNVASDAGGQADDLAGLGYGLPLSKAYAEFFDGRVEIQSLWGWGTDVYLKLKGLDRIE